jgi:hypothetical protein
MKGRLNYYNYHLLKAGFSSPSVLLAGSYFMKDIVTAVTFIRVTAAVISKVRASRLLINSFIAFSFNWLFPVVELEKRIWVSLVTGFISFKESVRFKILVCRSGCTLKYSFIFSACAIACTAANALR